MHFEVKNGDFSTKVYKDALSIRSAVFIHEQNIDPQLEIDEFEKVRIYFVLYIQKKPVGTLRLAEKSNSVLKVERMAVLKEFRHLGLASQLLRAVEDYARLHSFTSIHLNAQHQVVKFYKKNGFHVSGDSFMEAEILHYPMVKEI
ncbi:MAG: GNAT family N-acetyltransferase [Streptococcaceae bacterium]|jgi:predicted GNAT family N-acyltransferase|nr:GNAT family N-acetyltransferase [Streptococcaceae bacterium]